MTLSADGGAHTEELDVMDDETLEQLRRESPAYAGDDGWQEVPRPLGAVLSVRLDLPTMHQLSVLAEATHRTPSAVIRDWTVERLAQLGGFPSKQAHARAIGEASPEYLTENEALRSRYRPDRVRLLFVGESSPASGRFFYRADSNLFRATRDAFVWAFGPMPNGGEFLAEFRSRGAWLVDMSDRPVNRQRGRPRAAAVDAGIERLADTIAATQPERVIAVKSTLEGPVRRASQMAGIPPDAVHVLQFPVRQWRERFVNDLASLLAPVTDGRRPGEPGPQTTQTLHQAMAQVLADIGPLAPARAIANEVNRRGLYFRGDGRSLDYQQVLARARKYPQMFEITSEGVRLR
jgi:hypothetical protein